MGTTWCGGQPHPSSYRNYLVPNIELCDDLTVLCYISRSYILS